MTTLVSLLVPVVVSGVVSYGVSRLILDWGWRRDLRARRRVWKAEARERERWIVPSERGWVFIGEKADTPEEIRQANLEAFEREAQMGWTP